jgi:8-amino-7-oxononanoate synthase
MNAFAGELKRELEGLRAEGLYRELRRLDSPQAPRVKIGGRELLNFSSNDYLGLANHPALKETAIRAIEQYGAGAGASRLVCGSLGVHQDLDEAIAAFKGTNAALSFSTGYAAALGTIGALFGKDDVIIIDRLVHASIVDAARLCGARLRVFRHNDLNDLEEVLRAIVQSPKSKVQSPRAERIVIVTESVFSMDGDHAPLKEIVTLKEKHGAWLMVDEAHGAGLYGANRRGLAEEQGVSDRIEIQMGTLGKAMGASGGYICGSRPLIDCLINRARSFLFSTAPVPAAAGAATAGVRLVRSSAGEEYRQMLWKRVSQLRDSIGVGGLSEASGIGEAQADNGDLKPRSRRASAIMPLMIGDEKAAVEVARLLRERGILIPAIRYPTVSRGKARLRLTMTAAHTEDEIEQLAATLKTLDFKFEI